MKFIYFIYFVICLFNLRYYLVYMHKWIMRWTQSHLLKNQQSKMKI